MGECVSKVYLLNVPFENDYLHTWYFEGKDKAERKKKQEDYFLSKVIAKHKYTDFSYQRKDSSIRIPAQYDDVLGCNYVMYQNTAYGDGKWFYAFITDIKYVSDGRTDITIETDVLQTWMFDYDVKDSFIEREHVDDDTIGLHTIPEGLETGEYIHNFTSPDKFYMTSTSSNEVIYINDGEEIKGGGDGKNNTVDTQGVDVVVLSTVHLGMIGPDNKYINSNGGMFNGVGSGCGLYAYSDTATAFNYIKECDNRGQGDAVVGIFMAPRWAIKKITNDGSEKPYRVSESAGSAYRIWNTFTMKDTLNTYQPKNNKLLTYPYRYMLVTNNAGASAVYRYELFKHKDGGENYFDRPIYQFRVDCAITPGCSIRLTPINYCDTDYFYEEGLTGAKFPICSWRTDVFTNWLVQNGSNMTAETMGNAVSVIGGAAMMIAGLCTSASGIGAGMAISGAVSIGNGITGVASTLAKIDEHSFQPPQAKGNLNSGDVTFAMGNSTFTAYHMSIKQEYAKIIDNYFTMYGYKVSRVGKPKNNHRKRFWYTKTIGVNIDGAIPQKDLQKIKECYNNGITFWKFGAGAMGDYLTGNEISGE